MRRAVRQMWVSVAIPRITCAMTGLAVRTGHKVRPRAVIDAALVVVTKPTITVCDVRRLGRLSCTSARLLSSFPCALSLCSPIPFPTAVGDAVSRCRGILQRLALRPIIAGMSHHWCLLVLRCATTLIFPLALLLGHVALLLAHFCVVRLIPLLIDLCLGALALNLSACLSGVTGLV